MKNMEPSACLRILHPIAFFFKEKEVLAAHPLSCHPRRVFGLVRKGEKVRENGKNEKERELLKGSCLEIFINQQKRSLLTVQ